MPPIPGLYATGNAVAYIEQPGYFGGLSNGRNIVYAFLAASHAAGAGHRFDMRRAGAIRRQVQSDDPADL